MAYKFSFILDTVKNIKLNKLYKDPKQENHNDITISNVNTSKNSIPSQSNIYGGTSNGNTEILDVDLPTSKGKENTTTPILNSNNINNQNNSNSSTAINGISNAKNSSDSNLSNSNSAENNLKTTNNKSNTSNHNFDSSNKSEANQMTAKNNGSGSTNISNNSLNANNNTDLNNKNLNNGASSNLNQSLNAFSASSDDSNGNQSVTSTSISNNNNSNISEVDSSDYREILKSYGLRKEDIDRVISNEITLDKLLEEIDSDEDNSRKKEIMEASYLDSFGLEFNNIDELDAEIDRTSEELAALRSSIHKVDNHELESVSNILMKLKTGESLENILNNEIVAYKYIDEDGNTVYTYDNPYSSNNSINVQNILYEALTFEQMYPDSQYLDELTNVLDTNKKGNHYWSESPDQVNYYNDFIKGYGNKEETSNKNLDSVNEKISELEANLSTYKSVREYILAEISYYLECIDIYLNKDDYNLYNKYNDSSYDVIIDIKEKFGEAKGYNPGLNAPVQNINDKKQLVDILSCMLNDKVTMTDTILQADATIVKISTSDDLLKHYEDWLPFVTDNEKNIFNYIYNTEGYDAAYDYLEKISDELDNRWLANKTQEDSEYASEHPFIASAGSIFLTPIEGISAACYSMNSYLSGEKIRRSDVYSSGDVWRNRIAQDIADTYGEGWAFAYSTGMSIADSGVLVGVNIATGGTASVVLSATIMGSRVYVSTLNDALDRGLNDGEAITLAWASAAVETGMEYFSLSHLLNLEKKLGENSIGLVKKVSDAFSNDTLKKIATKTAYIFSSAVSQGIVEGEEEFTTEIIDFILDELISGELSNHTLAINDYISKGYSEEEARKLADKDFEKQMTLAFLGGFISGNLFGTLGGIKSAKNFTKKIANDMYNDFNSDINKLNTNINDYENFNDIFNDNDYGGDQLKALQIVEDAMTGDMISPIDQYKFSLINKLLENYIKDLTDIQKINILTSFANNGCAWISVANAFAIYIGSVKHGQQIFKNKFGYDLFTNDNGKTSYNVEAIALDMYLSQFSNTSNINEILNATTGLGISSNSFNTKIVQFLKKHGISIDSDTSFLLNSNDFSYNKLLEKIKSDTSKFYILSSTNFDLQEVNNPDNIVTGASAHAMIVTGIDEDENIIVSSWGKKYKILKDSIDYYIKMGLNPMVSLWDMKFSIDLTKGTNIVGANDIENKVLNYLGDKKQLFKENDRINYVVNSLSKIISYLDHLSTMGLLHNNDFRNFGVKTIEKFLITGKQTVLTRKKGIRSYITSIDKIILTKALNQIIINNNYHSEMKISNAISPQVAIKKYNDLITQMKVGNGVYTYNEYMAYVSKCKKLDIDYFMNYGYLNINKQLSQLSNIFNGTKFYISLYSKKDIFKYFGNIGDNFYSKIMAPIKQVSSMSPTPITGNELEKIKNINYLEWVFANNLTNLNNPFYSINGSLPKIDLNEKKSIISYMKSTIQGQFIANLTLNEVLAIYEYTAGSGTILKWLCNQKIEPHFRIKDPKVLNNIISGLDSSIIKYGGLKNDMILYRGDDIEKLRLNIHINNEIDLFSLIGKTITYDGYMSTGVSSFGAFSKPIRWLIKAPVGAKGIYVNDLSHYFDSDCEYEFILKCKTKFKINNVYYTTVDSSKVLIIDATIIE